MQEEKASWQKEAEHMRAGVKCSRACVQKDAVDVCRIMISQIVSQLTCLITESFLAGMSSQLHLFDA